MCTDELLGNKISCKNTFGVKTCGHASKVESYLEVNAWTDWQEHARSDIRIQPRGLAYTEHINTSYTCTGHIIATLLFSKFNWTT